MKKPLFVLKACAFTACILTTTLFAAPADPRSMDIAAKAVNTLGIELLRKTGSPDANALLSPYSIQSALAMTYAGADGVTRTEMAKVLHYPKDDASLHNSFAALRKTFEDAVRRSETNATNMRKYGGNRAPLSLTVANRLFGQSGYDFRSDFLALVKDSYAAPFEPVDFAKNPATATKHINQWVETQTKQRIRDLIPARTLDDLTRLVLVNAIHFKASWTEPFSKSETKSAPFYVNGDKSVNVPTMTLRHDLNYARGDGFGMLALPYDGYMGDFQFVILLPDQVKGLAALETKLTSDVISKAKWEERQVTLYLPKFKLEPPAMALGRVLQTLGMKTAFDVPLGSANFDRIAPRRPDGYLKISEVFHKTFLNLDEEGTEAAAATAVIVAEALGIPEPKKPVEFKVDHPFAFAIQHRPSGACLFLGHVTDPR